MQQNLDSPTLPDVQIDHRPSNHDITTEERVASLQKSSKGAVLKKNKKRDLLFNVTALKVSILEHSKLFDSINSSTLSESLNVFLNTINKMFIRKSSNEDLATKIVELYEPFSILYKHLKEQERAQNQVTSSL